MGARKYKVVIVGGGPAGSMTALNLVHLRPEMAGDILLLEAKAFPREKICGGGVSGRIVDALESLGVSLEGLPKVPVRRLSVYFEKKICDSSFGNETCFVARRSAFDDLLLAAVAERGVEVHTHTPAIGAYRERKGIAVLDRAGNVYHSEVVVGADGVNGRSRLWFGSPHRGHKSLLLQTEFPRDPGCELLQDSMIMDYSIPKFGIPGYTWYFPSIGEDGAPVVNAGISGGAFSKGSYARLREAFLATLDLKPEIKAGAPARIHFKPYPERVYPFFQARARERVIFVGEQLGVNPFTGEGLCICADSAEAAAREITCALDKGDFSFKGYGGRLVMSQFFPLYLSGKSFCVQPKSIQPSFFLVMATRSKPDGERNVVNYYTAAFSGKDSSNVLYSPTYWGMVMRDIAATLPGWVREVSGTSSSRR